MSLRGARVLLSGATGFIGSRVAAALDAAGAELTLLVRPSSQGGRLGALWDKAARVSADLDSPAELSAAVRTADPEIVVHLAKARGAPFERDAKASAALAAALASVPRLRRWVRTAHAAGELGRGADQELARALAARHGLCVVTLELYLVYGPGQGRGEHPRDLVEDALARRPIRAPAGGRDLVFIDDVAEAYRLAAERPGVDGAWLSIGGGRLVSGIEAAAAAAKAAGRRLDEILPPPPAPPPAGHPAELGRAREKLGWSPRVSLDDGIARLAAWCRHA